MDWKLKAFARKEDYSYNAKKRGKYTFSGQFLRGGVKAHQGDWGTSAGKNIQRWKRGALGAKAGGEKIHTI